MAARKRIPFPERADRPLPVGQIGHMMLGLNGYGIERTPQTNPYSHDSFVLYNSGEPHTGDLYSDHVRHNYPDTREAAYEKSKLRFDSRAPDLDQTNTFLSVLLGRPIVVTKIILCCNQATGYPILFWQWREA